MANEQIPLGPGDEVTGNVYDTPGQMAATFGENAVNTATFNLTKPILSHVFNDPVEEQDARAEINPASALAGKAVGFGASLLPGGPLEAVGAVGKGTRAIVGEGALGHIAATAAEGATIGGASTFFDQLAGQNPALNAEKIAADAGFGALIGGGLGILGKGVESIAGKASKNLEDMNFGKGPIAEDQLGPAVENIAKLQEAVARGKNAIYEEAGRFHLNNALDQINPNEAQGLAQDAMNKIGEALQPVTTEAPALTPAANKIMQDHVANLSEALSKASDARDVHEALNQFAKDIDSGKLIKFDKFNMNPAQQADQDILHGIRDTIRGDLSDGAKWGAAGPIYQQQSELYSNLAQYGKQFQKDFLTKRVMQGESGPAVTFTPDPAKIGSLINAPAEKAQFKMDNMNNLYAALKKAAQFSEDYGRAQEGATEIENALSKHAESLQKSQQDILENQKAFKAQKAAPVPQWGAVESILSHVNPTLGMSYHIIRKWIAKGGQVPLGGGINAAKDMAAALQNSNDKIARGVTSIFARRDHDKHVQ